MSVIIEEKIADLKHCINKQSFASFKDCEIDEVLQQEDYFKTLISTIGLYASVHPEEYIENKQMFYDIVLGLEKDLNVLRQKKQEDGDVVETSALVDDPTNSELLANSYGTTLLLFCAIDTMNQGKFNFNYFKGKYPKTTLRTLPLNCFNELDIKITLACETDKKLYDNFLESNLSDTEKEFIVETFDEFNIRGPELRLVVRAVCGNNFKKVYTLAKLLSLNEPFTNKLVNKFVLNINQNQGAHSTFKAQRLTKIDGFLLDSTRPFLTKLDAVKEPTPLMYFNNILELLTKEERKQLDFLKSFLDENGNTIKINEAEITDFDIRAIFTQNEISNLENLLKDKTQFNLYFSRLCLELRNFKETSISPIVLDKLNIGKEKQKEQAKKKDRIYTIFDEDICVLDYVEASLLTPHTKMFFVNNILKYGSNKIKNCFDTLISYNILNKKVDKLTKYTSSNNSETFFEICSILKETTSFKTQVLNCINSDNDQRTLAQIKEDLERSKIDLNVIGLNLDDSFNNESEDFDTDNINDVEKIDTDYDIDADTEIDTETENDFDSDADTNTDADIDADNTTNSNADLNTDEVVADINEIIDNRNAVDIENSTYYSSENSLNREFDYDAKEGDDTTINNPNVNTDVDNKDIEFDNNINTDIDIEGSFEENEENILNEDDFFNDKQQGFVDGEETVSNTEYDNLINNPSTNENFEDLNESTNTSSDLDDLDLTEEELALLKAYESGEVDNIKNRFKQAYNEDLTDEENEDLDFENGEFDSVEVDNVENGSDVYFNNTNSNYNELDSEIDTITNSPTPINDQNNEEAWQEDEFDTFDNKEVDKDLQDLEDFFALPSNDELDEDLDDDNNYDDELDAHLNNLNNENNIDVPLNQPINLSINTQTGTATVVDQFNPAEKNKETVNTNPQNTQQPMGQNAPNNQNPNMQGQIPNMQNGFMPGFFPFFNPYQNPNGMQNMPAGQMPNGMQSPNMQGQSPNMQGQNPNMQGFYPYGYPYPFFPNMMMPNMQQTPAPEPKKEEPKEEPEVESKPLPEVPQYVSRSQKLEEAFFKGVDTSSVNYDDLKPQPKAEPTPKKEEKLSGEAVGMSMEDFFADLNPSSNTDPDDPDNE